VHADDCDNAKNVYIGDFDKGPFTSAIPGDCWPSFETLQPRCGTGKSGSLTGILETPSGPHSGTLAPFAAAPQISVFHSSPNRGRGDRSCVQIAEGVRSWAGTAVRHIPDPHKPPRSVMTVTVVPTEARPDTLPPGSSNKGPAPCAPGRRGTHRSDSWSTCTAPPPWRPQSLGPRCAGAARPRPPAPSPAQGPGGEEHRQQGHHPAWPRRPLPAPGPRAETPGPSHIFGPGAGSLLRPRPQKRWPAVGQRGGARPAVHQETKALGGRV
jgi:hypothetical protein